MEQLYFCLKNRTLKFQTELYKSFNPSPEADTKMTNNKGGNPNGKNKRLIKKKGQNVNRNRGNTTSTTNRKRKSKKNDFDEKCEEKDNTKGFSLSSVFSSLHNIQQQVSISPTFYEQHFCTKVFNNEIRLMQCFSTFFSLAAPLFGFKNIAAP